MSYKYIVIFYFTVPIIKSHRRVARSTRRNIAHLKSHIAPKRTLLHKKRKKYRPKHEIWAFFAFLLTNFIAQRSKISPKFPIWAMKSPIWPPCPRLGLDSDSKILDSARLGLENYRLGSARTRKFWTRSNPTRAHLSSGSPCTSDGARANREGVRSSNSQGRRAVGHGAQTGVEVGMGANRTRIRELADSQPILLIRTNSQFARTDLRVGESEKMTKTLKK